MPESALEVPRFERIVTCATSGINVCLSKLVRAVCSSQWACKVAQRLTCETLFFCLLDLGVDLFRR